MSEGQRERPCCDGIRSFLRPEVFKALADQNRSAILALLASSGKEQSVSEVAKCCPVDLSVVSRHLGALRRAGLLDAERRGKEVYYSLRVKELVTMLRGLADALEACCPDGTCILQKKHQEKELNHE